MKQVDLDIIRRLYNSAASVWSDDAWHTHSRDQILHQLNACDFLAGTEILNAGSGGTDYGLYYTRMLHVDIADEKISHYSEYLVSTIESIPIQTDTFDNAICVGSVLNYCDPVSAISELHRVLKPGGHLVLEFESSWGFEYIGREAYKKDAVVTGIEYMNATHNQWLFSPAYIKEILETYHFLVVKEYGFHILDGLISKVFSDKLSVQISRKLDVAASRVPYTRKRANNIMYVCKKL